jgi:F420-0:gamma-glutamyl ligase
VGSAGIDESNGDGHYILYPEDPFKSAKRMRTWLMKQYGVRELAVIITDSTSIPLRRGAIGFALAWDGVDPMRDYRNTPDIFGRLLKIEVANLIDPLAAAAVLEMGEGDEQTPVAVIRGAKNIRMKNNSPKGEQLIVSPEDDIFAPLLWRKGWKKGGSAKH